MEILKSNGEGSPKQEDKLHLDNAASLAYLELVKSRKQAEIAKEPKDVEYGEFVARKREVDFFAKAGATPYIMETYKYSMQNLYDGNWRNSINNSTFVKLVGNDVKMQDTLRLTGELVVSSNNEQVYIVDSEVVFEKMPIVPYTPREPELELVERVNPEQLDANIENTKKVMGAKNFAELFAVMDSFGGTIPSETHGTIPTEHLKTMINNYHDGTTPIHFDSGPDALTYITKTYGLREKVYDLLLFSEELGRKAERGGVTSVDIDLGQMEAEAKKKKAEWEINGPIENWGEDPGFIRPINGDVAPIKELIGDLSKSETATEGVVETVEKKRRMTEEEYNAQVEIWKKSLEGARVAVENAEKALLASREKSQENLKAMGLTNIEKGLAAWKKVHPGYKMALGLALGASGLGAVSVGLSALTFTEKGYSERRDAFAKEGKTESKYWTFTKAAGIGILLALGTSQLSHLVGGAISEHAPTAIDKIKDFFSFGSAPSVPDVSTAGDISMANSLNPGESVGPESIPVTPDVPTPDAIVEEVPVDDVSSYNMDTTNPAIHEAVFNADNTISAPEASIAEYTTPEIMTDMTSPINLDQPYVMQPGDNTDSILRRVLNDVPELKVLPEEGKLKFISDLKEQWSTPISGASTPNWALKEMIGGATGTEVHHLDHVKGAFVTLGERANIINTIRN